MNRVDPKLTALQFNEYINAQHTDGLTSMMTEGHTFIDRKGQADRGREIMRAGWTDFFRSFPDYKNTFERVQSQDNLVVLVGYATWREGGDPDYAIWTARIEDDLVAEWRIYEDTDANRRKFGLV